MKHVIHTKKTDTTQLPTIISKQSSYYWIVNDPQIPGNEKRNIIPNQNGLTLIADHYSYKYHIEILIHPFFLTIDILANELTNLLHEVRKSYLSNKKIGFLLISADEPLDQFGHALPMIFERENETEEHLFFLDTNQFFADTTTNDSMLLFFKTLREKNPILTLWRIFGSRQIDYSSCFTDAMVVLKDSLRISLSFKTLVQNRICEQTENIIVFYAPAFLIRTAQVGSLFQKSKVDLTDIITHPCNKKKQMTVREFKEKYDITVLVSSENLKTVGLFTIRKGQRYEAFFQKKEFTSLSMHGHE